MNAISPLNKDPILDSEGRSPWVGRARTFEEFSQLPFPTFSDPYPIEPEVDLIIPGLNGVDGLRSEYRLGKELWSPGFGFRYREALSCNRTKLNARTRAAVQYIQEHIETTAADQVYLTEMATPMFEYMRGRYPLIQGSEYLPGVPFGTFHEGVRCEDLQALTFENDTFDLVLSFDVLEHLSDYKIGIYEMARALKDGGHLVMTAPIDVESKVSHGRAIINATGELEHLLPPEYHGNPVGPPSLCYTSFGFDLVEDLLRYGFRDSFIQFYFNVELGYWGRPEVLFIATK